MEQKYKIIAIDFDGTLFETDYPRIVRPILPTIRLAKERRARGDKLILWTCREGPELDAAIEECREQGLEFDAVNDNLPEMKEQWGNNPRKVSADEYWDDKNVWHYEEYNENGDCKYCLEIYVGEDKKANVNIWQSIKTYVADFNINI